MFLVDLNFYSHLLAVQSDNTTISLIQIWLVLETSWSLTYRILLWRLEFLFCFSCGGSALLTTLFVTIVSYWAQYNWNGLGIFVLLSFWCAGIFQIFPLKDKKFTINAPTWTRSCEKIVWNCFFDHFVAVLATAIFWCMRAVHLMFLMQFTRRFVPLGLPVPLCLAEYRLCAISRGQLKMCSLTCGTGMHSADASEVRNSRP